MRGLDTVVASEQGVIFQGVRMSVSFKVYPHNDLMNLSYHHVKIIRKKLESGENSGIKLDCTSALISMAFTIEALINFVGHKKLGRWKERIKYHKKLNKVCNIAGIDKDNNKGIFDAISTLKIIRDEIAHGKPVEDEDESASSDSIDKLMCCSWDEHCSPEFVEEAFEAVKQFRNKLFEGCDIKIGSTLTSATGWG